MESITDHPMYRAWYSMRSRCDSKMGRDYAAYGGRGISYPVAWRDFHQFFRDMGERPAGCSLDRIDNDKSYGPDNCRWATPKEQARNRRDSRRITYQGKTKTMAEWADESAVSYDAFKGRLRIGWSMDRALKMPNMYKQ